MRNSFSEYQSKKRSTSAEERRRENSLTNEIQDPLGANFPKSYIELAL